MTVGPDAGRAILGAERLAEDADPGLARPDHAGAARVAGAEHSRAALVFSAFTAAEVESVVELTGSFWKAGMSHS